MIIMAVEFKKLAGVDTVATATDAANVLIEEGGTIKRVPKTEVGGSGSSEPEVVIIDTSGGTEHIGNVKQKMIDSLDNNIPTIFYLKLNDGIYLVSSINPDVGEIYFSVVTYDASLSNQTVRTTLYKITASNTIEPVI